MINKKKVRWLMRVEKQSLILFIYTSSRIQPLAGSLRSPPQFIADVDHASIDYIKVTKNLYVPKEKLRIGKD